MFKKILLLLSVFALGAVGLVSDSSQTAFSRGNHNVCTGEVSGILVDSNPNIGRTVFSWEENVDLSIVGLEEGKAPGTEALAACAHEEVSGGVSLRGWAWNENLGFVSLGCQNGFNVSSEVGGKTPCGPQNYQVVIDEEGNFSGYAWNPVFGYMQFRVPGWEQYGVKIGENGYTIGYIWTQAGVWINLSGMYVDLGNVVEIVENCEDKNAPAVCLQVNPDPNKPGQRAYLEFEYWPDMKVADGEDFYTLELHLRGEDGKPLRSEDFSSWEDFVDSIELDWENTVKLMSNEVFHERLNNAIIGLPKKFSGFTWNDSTGVWEAKIKSYAPTKSGNLSWTTSTPTSAPFFNEDFLREVPSVDIKGSNVLRLNKISYGDLKDNEGKTVIRASDNAVIAGDHTKSRSFHFKPAVDVETLYVDNFQDVISVLRGTWNFVTAKVVKRGSFANGGTIDSPKVSLKLYYDDNDAGFDLSLLASTDFEGEEGAGANNEDSEESQPISFQKLNLNGEQGFVVQSVLSDGQGSSPVNPTLWTEVVYTIDGKSVQYYSNKIPRLPGDMVWNPALVVHGAIQARLDKSISKDGVVDTSGQVNMRTGRETIDRNLTPYKGTRVGEHTSPCTIYGQLPSGDLHLGFSHPMRGIRVCGSNNYNLANIEGRDEKIVYFGRNDLVIDLIDPPGQIIQQLSGNWVIVVEGGNIFIDRDIFLGKDEKPKVSLVALRSGRDLSTGNIYIHPDVRDIQAVLIADGAVFSYDGDRDNIDSDTGEPEWVSLHERAQTLDKQLIISGAVSTGMNTLGGADFSDVDAFMRILTGGRKLVSAIEQDKIMSAQNYDLNYLRMFRLSLEYGDNGCPIEQKCQVPICAKDALDKANDSSHEIKHPETAEECTGKIDATRLYDKTRPATSGDLVEPEEGNLSRANRGGDYGPVYIYQVQPAIRSVIFTR
jgi:hypothetical protein